MTTNQPNIHVNVQSGTGEVLRIVATVLLFGGAGAVAWSVAQGAHAELAASGMTMMIVMMARLMYARGMVRIPAGSGGDDFTATKSAISQITGEYKKWLAGTSMPALALISIGYAIAFLLLRAAVSAALGVFSNLYVAGGFAAMVGAIVVFPSLLPSILSSLKRKGVVTTDPNTVQAAPAQQVPAPAPAPQVPVAPVQQDAPVAPAPKKIVRRVVKKEQ
ncbi:hypothetical protein nbrc107696_08330 [Gordonia spumicola]|uniref:Uncharacterized protein n=1 Tax=Gordonia spumicola TaxID=589161 RepID=A0A7I9V560_9ACTN|nr:hypothetical protein [Gordonia spumicola]GEE00387.1 hypothetical protein nbrc107696_08330 [Gordonia spumicola]